MLRVLSPTVARWVPHLIVTCLAAGAGAYLMDLRTSDAFAIEIAMASTSDGTMRVFYDRGGGITEQDSIVGNIRASAETATYRLPLPAGVYRMLRIDPNDRAGDYSFSRIRVVAADGEEIADIPVQELRPALQTTLTLLSQSVVAHVPPGANGPQLIYVPRADIVLAEKGRTLNAALFVLGIGAAALLLFVVLDFVLRVSVLAPVTAFLSRSPGKAVAIAAVLATVVATYPIFIGRSFVSPNNGGTAMLYDEAPFIYGSDDLAVEDTRGSDVGSMMWAILPYVVSQREAVSHGEFPLWNRYNAIGRPLWGQAQHFFLEPAHLIALAVPDPAYRADVAFVAGRAIFAVGVGMAALAATSSLVAAVIVAVSAPFIGHFAFRFNHPAYFSIVYVPWILWAYFRLSTRTTTGELLRGGAVLVLASALQLVGSTPKEGIIAFGVASACGFLALLLAAGTGAERLRRCGAAVLAAVLSLLVAAPHWLIFLDTLGRAYTAYEQPAAIFGGWHKIAALALGIWLPGMPNPALNGVVALLVAVALLTPLVLWRHRGLLACAIGGLAAIAIACGAVPERLILSLPLLGNIYHVWNVFFTASLPPLLIVASAGVVALLEAPRRAAVVILIGVVLLALVIDIGLTAPPARSAGLILASLAPAVAFAILPPLRRRAAASAVAVAAMMTLAIGLLPGGLHVETGVSAVDAVLLQPRERVALDKPPPSVRAVRRRAGGEPFRVASLGDVLFSGTQGFYRLEGITGPDALELRELRELSDAAGIHRTDWGWRSILTRDDLVRARGLLDMLGVRFVFGRGFHLPAGAPRLPMSEPDLVEVVERESAWPRAFFVDGVRTHASLDDLMTTLNASGRPFASVDSSDMASAQIGTRPSAETLVVPARDYRLTPNRTSLTIDTPAPGVVVVAEAYVPRDFRATLNGERVGYFRVNHALKAIRIPSAGSWSITFEYQPERWILSWILSAIGMAATLALVIKRWPVR